MLNRTMNNGVVREVSPETIEAQLLKHELIQDVVVCGRPSLMQINTLCIGVVAKRPDSWTTQV